MTTNVLIVCTTLLTSVFVCGNLSTNGRTTVMVNDSGTFEQTSEGLLYPYRSTKSNLETVSSVSHNSTETYANVPTTVPNKSIGEDRYHRTSTEPGVDTTASPNAQTTTTADLTMKDQTTEPSFPASSTNTIPEYQSHSATSPSPVLGTTDVDVTMRSQMQTTEPVVYPSSISSVDFSKDGQLHVTYPRYNMLWNTFTSDPQLQVSVGQQSPPLLLQAEYAIIDPNRVIPRSHASNSKVVRVLRSEALIVEFCLMKDTKLKILDVKYANDGGDDLIEVSIDNKVIDHVQTMSVNMGGAGWNVFRSTGPLQKAGMFTGGRHRLKLTVLESDSYGVEIDYVEFLLNSQQEEISLKCRVYCFEDIDYKLESFAMADQISSFHLAKGTLVQKSEHTSCAEEDNINIEIFHETARRFIVTAGMPKYPSFANHRKPDFDNCKMAETQWSFTNVQCFGSFSIDSGRTTLVSKGRIDGLVLRQDFLITFYIPSPDEGMIDSEIGSIVYMDIYPINSLVNISLQYLNRYDQWSKPNWKYVLPNGTHISWYIHDKAWRIGEGNKVKIEISIQKDQLLVIRKMVMDKRHQRDDQPTTIYEDGMTIIEAMDIEFWWRMNETMTIETKHDGKIHHADYFRIYHRVPWSDSEFSQVFVMYQDGNVRLLPVTPHGLDWVPFGSSIVIGQLDRTSIRPTAPIRHIEIDPSSLHLRIHYMDGGIIAFQIKINLKQTELVVSGGFYKRDMRIHPFLTFRSMWVADGNADVDHVSADKQEPRHIISDWDKLTGNHFSFFRRCISKHNTLSPDIQVHIID